MKKLLLITFGILALPFFFLACWWYELGGKKGSSYVGRFDDEYA